MCGTCFAQKGVHTHTHIYIYICMNYTYIYTYEWYIYIHVWIVYIYIHTHMNDIHIYIYLILYICVTYNSLCSYLMLYNYIYIVLQIMYQLKNTSWSRCFESHLQRLGRRGSSNVPGVPFELLEMRQEHVDGPPRRKWVPEMAIVFARKSETWVILGGYHNPWESQSINQ